ncbi:MAG TPA: class I SAM-dependent methyltransferase [Bryobacteraceae bacterium]|nr:class I SAM-dependent methyltransferase [Bryobacteraceae bacterium]
MFDTRLSVERNREHYNSVYESLELEPLLDRARDLGFFTGAIRKHTSWHGLYRDGFAQRLGGRTVLELGAGDGLNALIMARLGARVTAVEIAEPAVRMLRHAASVLSLEVNAVCGDFLAADFPQFDFIVGKAFLHHLDHELEERFVRKCAALLKRNGEARFMEPAVNSALLDTVRWIVPAPERPSILQRAAFAEWQASDPHPKRDQSSAHYARVGKKYFRTVHVIPFAGLERFRRVIPNRTASEAYAEWALRAEPKILPASVRCLIARAQTIIYANPLREGR